MESYDHEAFEAYMAEREEFEAYMAELMACVGEGCYIKDKAEDSDDA